MRKMKKTCVYVVSITCLFLLVCSSSIANEKVVVIPLNSTKKIATSGQTFTGAIVAKDNDDYDFISISFPLPLPPATPKPKLEVQESGSSSNCPGIGQSTAGYMCIYVYDSFNFSYIYETTGSSGSNRLHGAIYGVKFESTSGGRIYASWAYTIP